MTKTVRIHKTGGPEVLQIEDLPVGDPGPGEIRIRVQSIGLNRSEAIYRAGKYLVAPKLPSSWAMRPSAWSRRLGPGVQGHAPGDRVCVIPTYRLGEYGVYAQSAIVPARSVFAAPVGLTAIQSSAIWMAFLTAYAIIEVAKVSIGDFVLIPAASSSVGLAAIQLANWAGAVPIALTRHSNKAAALREQGAQHVVPTEETDVVAEVMRITGGKGARTAFDPVGGPLRGETVQCSRRGGILFIYGSLSNQPTPYPHWTVALKGLSIRGWVFSAISNKPERYQRRVTPSKPVLLRGILKPVIAKTFTLDQIADAHAYLESNQQVGKIVVTV